MPQRRAILGGRLKRQSENRAGRAIAGGQAPATRSRWRSPRLARRIEVPRRSAARRDSRTIGPGARRSKSPSVRVMKIACRRSPGRSSRAAARTPSAKPALSCDACVHQTSENGVVLQRSENFAGHIGRKGDDAAMFDPRPFRMGARQNKYAVAPICSDASAPRICVSSPRITSGAPSRPITLTPGTKPIGAERAGLDGHDRGGDFLQTGRAWRHRAPRPILGARRSFRTSESAAAQFRPTICR